MSKYVKCAVGGILVLQLIVIFLLIYVLTPEVFASAAQFWAAVMAIIGVVIDIIRRIIK